LEITLAIGIHKIYPAELELNEQGKKEENLTEKTYQLEPECDIGDMQAFSSSWCGHLQGGQRVGKSFPAKNSFDVERDDEGRREHR
jgi:hypothetical protein